MLKWKDTQFCRPASQINFMLRRGKALDKNTIFEYWQHQALQIED